MSNERRSRTTNGRSDVPARRTPKRGAPKGRTPQRRPPNRRPPQPGGWRSRRALFGALAAALVVVVTAVVVFTTGSSGPQLGGPPGPEAVNLETGPILAPAGAVAPSIGAAAGVQCGATEQLATHTHTHLAVFVDGTLRPIPAGVGFLGKLQTQPTANGTFVTGTSQCLYWLHTHAQDGIVHVEAPAGRTFVLGQFFVVWGQPLSRDRVGPAAGPVTAYLNGHRWTQALENIPLGAHDVIQLDVGTPAVAARSVHIPSSL